MILCVGEILVDKINDKLYPGGAPFNLANQIKKLNGDVAFLGSVGNDLYGEFLINFSQSQFGSNSYIDKLKKDTTLAIVTIKDDKDRSFSFHRNDTADSYINIDLIKKLADSSSIIHFGSLPLSNKNTRNELIKIIEELKLKNKIISFDVNYRNDIFNDINILKDFSKKADILKLSIDELELFNNIKIDTQEKLISSIKKISLDNQLIVVTLGKYGSCYYLNGLFNIIKTIKVDVVDTTGAGDSFFGALLYKYNEYKKAQKAITKEILDEILDFSNICAALSTCSYGAIDSQCNLETILKTKNHII